MRKLLVQNHSTLKFIRILFLGVWVILVYFYYHKDLQENILALETQFQGLLRNHRALHSYVEDIQKPVIYQLKDDKKLYREFFSPKILSFTFIARGVQNYLRKEREQQHLLPIHFKLASNNARNIQNQADAFEASLLKKMNQSIDSKTGESTYQYKEIIQENNEDYLYIAIPVRPNKNSCMRCHGDPKDAPKEMIDIYGDKRGFYEKPGEIRALISIKAPLKTIYQAVNKHTLHFALLCFVLLAALYLTIYYFVRRLDEEQQHVREQNRLLEKLSVTDKLTGLFNRHLFDQTLKSEINKARRYTYELSIIILDLDYFKKINDNYGHLTGDAVLQCLANLIHEHFRSTDTCARWGGEEFIILVPHLDLQKAIQLAEKLRVTIENATFPEDIHITASIGVASLREDDSKTSLLARADNLLYQAKNKGRNRVEYEVPDNGEKHV